MTLMDARVHMGGVLEKGIWPRILDGKELERHIRYILIMVRYNTTLIVNPVR
jgi:hypothetical protein